ncbi:Paraneoplastic antigen Ma2 [Merluccius polli]|uniref:Paraneoplastic antigen Ma2 n=1 Tax=Merluccius polli TaxID=89951 RepID=A0AA47P488_MERPO|nr:Paraneoplastic antigen Ma2 [Merluccius polli]
MEDPSEYKAWQQTELLQWCRSEGIDLKHAILVIGVSEDLGVGQIEDVLHTVRCWGRVRVRGRKFSSEAGGLLVLCECKEELVSSWVPPEVRPADSDAVWEIVKAEETPAAPDDFSEKLKIFLAAEGKSVADLKGFCTPVPPGGTSDAVLQSLADAISRANKGPTESHSYRRLRIFSGIIPTPAGEESLDYWLEQATLMVQESEWTEQEKKRRISESLRGLALEVVKSLRLSRPGASPEDYLNALDNAFGSAESGDDLYFSFRLIQQKAGEKLSDYVRRLEPILAKVVKKGGIADRDKDRVRVEQLLRGAIGSDWMLLKMRLNERKVYPPDFLDLLTEIRTEEEHDRTRQRVNTRVRSVAARDESAETDTDIVEELRADFRALKTYVSEMNKRPSFVEEEAEVRPLASQSFQSGKDEAEAVALRKKVNRLEKKWKAKGGNVAEPQVAAAAVVMKPADRGFSAQRQSFRSDGDRFCYRCGEDGHIATKCSSPENEKRVIRRLIASLNKAKRNYSPGRDLKDDTTHCSARKQAVHAKTTATFPKGLIGPPTTAQVKVNGHPCTAILDSGSQVTIIFEKWYEEHLSNVTIHPVSGLAIWGLSDTSYPYLGYVLVDMQFPKELVGKSETLSVLALICPGPNTPDQVPVILGTNASLFHRLAALCGRQQSETLARTLNISGFGLKKEMVSQSVSEGDPDETVGLISWMGPGQLTIPPLESCCVPCQVDYCQAEPEGIIMVEASDATPLPQGVMLQPVRNRDNVIPVVDTADEHDNASNHEESEVEPEVISEPEHVIANESDDIGNTVNDADAPVGQRSRTVSDRDSVVAADEEVNPQRNSPRRGKRSIKPVIRLTYDERNRDNVIPVVDTADEHDNASNHEESEVEPEVISEPEHVIANESDDIGNTVNDADAPVGQRSRTVSDRDSVVAADEEVNPQRNSPRRGKRSIKPVIRLTYDEVGRSKDQPLTIVHRGVVIKIG